jgi:hypothetical protein
MILSKGRIFLYNPFSFNKKKRRKGFISFFAVDSIFLMGKIYEIATHHIINNRCILSEKEKCTSQLKANSKSLQKVFAGIA